MSDRLDGVEKEETGGMTGEMSARKGEQDQSSGNPNGAFWRQLDSQRELPASLSQVGASAIADTRAVSRGPDLAAR
jgi:hypothetical protein